jgi:hypothetical protein
MKTLKNLLQMQLRKNKIIIMKKTEKSIANTSEKELDNNKEKNEKSIANTSEKELDNNEEKNNKYNNQISVTIMILLLNII